MVAGWKKAEQFWFPFGVGIVAADHIDEELVFSTQTCRGYSLAAKVAYDASVCEVLIKSPGQSKLVSQ